MLPYLFRFRLYTFFFISTNRQYKPRVLTSHCFPSRYFVLEYTIAPAIQALSDP